MKKLNIKIFSCFFLSGNIYHTND